MPMMLLRFDVNSSTKGTIPSLNLHRGTRIGMTSSQWVLNKSEAPLISLMANCAPGRFSSPFFHCGSSGPNMVGIMATIINFVELYRAFHQRLHELV